MNIILWSIISVVIAAFGAFLYFAAKHDIAVLKKKEEFDKEVEKKLGDFCDAAYTTRDIEELEKLQRQIEDWYNPIRLKLSTHVRERAHKLYGFTVGKIQVLK